MLDLDVHPPDGTAACLHNDSRAWVGSLSGADWGALPPWVDETVLPPGTNDSAYLRALAALLDRAPPARLTFVLAGGDVRKGDPLDTLHLTERGVQERDLKVAQRLAGAAAVWLPAGGYGEEAWRVLAGSASVLVYRRQVSLPRRTDPLRERFDDIRRALADDQLGGGLLLDEDDMAALFGFSTPRGRPLLGFYTNAGVELALSRYGFVEVVTRYGYGPISVELDRTTVGDRLRVFARERDAGPTEERHLLLELVLEIVTPEELEDRLLFVHWLTLRHPLAAFTDGRPPLPGQEVPGLGLAREVGEVLRIMATRLGCTGVAVRPAWLHVAYAARHDFRFVEPIVQGELEALLRDLGDRPLQELTQHVAEGRVARNGRPYTWNAALMVTTPPSPDDAARWREQVAETAARTSFSVIATQPRTTEEPIPIRAPAGRPDR